MWWYNFRRFVWYPMQGAVLAALTLALTSCAGSHPVSSAALPSVPANVSAVAGNTQISLSWLASTDSLGVAAYLLERCQGANCTGYVQIVSLGGTTTSYTDSGLKSNTVYNYRVRAQDAASNLSAYSNVATATTGSGIAPPVITSSGTAAATMGAAFSYQITATNSPASFGASRLPTGLTVNTASGLISGTPTGAGSFTMTLSATNGGGTGSAPLSLAVTETVAPPEITSGRTASGTVGTTFSYEITSTNSPTSFGASGLPSGLAVNTSSGLISGTPTAAGASNLTLTATNSGGTGSAPLTLTVTATVVHPVITSGGTANATMGTAFSYQIAATNSPTSFGASGLPSGLTVNTASGLISGTPAAAGTSNVTLSATNSGGTGSAPLTLTVTVAAPVITSNGADGGTVGTAFSYQITATNSPTSFGASGLPSGLAVNTASGLISGTSATAGTSNVTLSATNGGGTGSAPLTLTMIMAAPAITSSGTASGTVGTAFSYQITATNSPTSFGASGLPAGFTVSTSSGLISGTPTGAGTSSVTLAATNSGGTGSAPLTLTVTVPAPVITSSGTASGTVAAAFSYQITATNSPTGFGASGLPSGLAVNTTSGLISGTPASAGTSNVTLSATNGKGTVTAPLTLTVTATVASPVITSNGAASGTVGTAFSYQITATNSPTSFSTSVLPSGLAVNTTSGLISGTPTGAGSSSVTLSATNSGGTGSAPLTLTVTVAAPVITSSGAAGGTVGTALSYQITATNSPTGFGASGLPSGLAVNATSGLISGTPTGEGTFNVTLSATNSGGTGSATLTISVNGGGTGPLVSHTIQISNDADDGYYNSQNNSGWHSTPETGGADTVGSWGGLTTAWVTGYRFPSVGANSGDTIQSAYLQLVSSDGSATSAACGSPPCSNSIYTFRVYGVAQDNGAAFSGVTGNTPLDVPYTTAYTNYTTTGPGDDHGSCQLQNNGQNTCTHFIDVSNIVREITSRPGWTSSSAMRFVMLSADGTAPNVYAGYEDYSADAGRAATLVVNPPMPTIVSSGAWGSSASLIYPTTYSLGPFVYPGASTLLLFLGDYYNFYGLPIPQPTISDSCGNNWNVLAGPSNWVGISYFMRSTVYYVQNPASCPAGATITVTAAIQEPIFLHFLAIAGANTANPPTVSAISSPSPGTYTTSASSNSITLTQSGLLVSWVFGDSDAPHVFTPQAGFITDLNSTPNYLTAVFENVLSPGSYQSQFSISPSDGWQAVIIGLQAP